MFEIGKRFKPDPALKKVYGTYLSLASVPPLIVAVVLPLAVSIYEPQLWREAWLFTLIPLIVVLACVGFAAYWISKYYDSIWFTLEKDEVVVERGVWWKMRHVVPYSRVMAVDTIQGPISRRFGLGSVYIYTAGYTGAAGGTAGPGTRGAEAVIWGVRNFNELRDVIISMVRGRPLLGAPEAVTRDVGLEILEELRRIRKAIEERRPAL